MYTHVAADVWIEFYYPLTLSVYINIVSVYSVMLGVRLVQYLYTPSEWHVYTHYTARRDGKWLCRRGF